MNFYRFVLLNENVQSKGMIDLIHLLQRDIEGVSMLSMRHEVNGS